MRDLFNNNCLAAYFTYLVENLEDYQERRGSRHEFFICRDLAEIEKNHLRRLVLMNIFSKVFDDTDVDFTGPAENDSIHVGYELTEKGKEIYEQFKFKNKSKYLSLKNWLKLCHDITNTPKKSRLPCWMSDAYRELVGLYSEPSRKYHNLLHIAHCLDEFDAVRHLVKNPNELEIAIWYHDVVYNTRKKNNEEKSAEFMQQRLSRAGIKTQFIDDVTDLILATKHQTIPKTSDGKYLVDIDLSILGKTEEEFDRYERCIKDEYFWVPEEQFRQSRIAILRGFLDRDSIFLTNFFRQKYEKQARKNLQRSIVQLES